MGNAVKIFFLFLFIIAGAYLSGVRVHPEAFSSPALPALALPKGVELQFQNGQKAAGKIVKEIPGGIIFNMDGAEVSFTNEEIVSRREISLSSPVSAHSKQKSPWVTYDPGLSIFAQIAGKDTEKKKPAFQASSLWGAKPRSAAETPMPGTMSGAKSADPDSLMGIYQKSMSKESLDAWKTQAVDALNSGGRNPFVEARNAAQAKAAASNTSRSEAKLKELEENGY